MEILAGKTVTLSANVNGQIASMTYELPEDLTSYDSPQLQIPDTNAYLDIYSYPDSDNISVRIFAQGMDTVISVEWIKLELGAVATAYEEPDPATELMRCQRYYCKGRFAFKMSDVYYSKDFAIIPMVRFPTDMRITPTVVIHSDAGTLNTLSVWADRSDSTTYTTCVARTLNSEGFNALGAIAGNFSEADPTYLLGYFTASAEIGI